MIVGRTYYERGKPVKVLAQWRHRGNIDMGRTDFQFVLADLSPKTASGPRNVLIQREDGSLVVRPFRGLRKERAR